MSAQASVIVRRHNLPRQLTPFIGRQIELTQILNHLADPTCCLLTLAGPGGMGKTRLALEAAQSMVSDGLRIADSNTTDNRKFHDGIFFVNLQPIPAAEFLAAAVCDVLALPLSSHEAPETQLIHYLQDKDLLFVLDNFEHLMEGVTLITQLLQAAPNVKLLVTSREALNLQEEKLFRIGGLALPATTAADSVKATEEQSYSAIELFVERARRVRHNFAFLPEKEAVIQICHLVEGMPLAIELAAAWTRTMGCAEIAQEIQQRAGFLATNLRNMPERHRSMVAVFAYSWQRLTAEEQNVFQKLAVFRGGFDRPAGEQVAGATLSLLSALVDKSLLRWEPDGRYQIHELLRQFAQEQLDRSLSVAAQTREAHGHYYAAFAFQCYTALTGHEQTRFPGEITREIDNLRQAWQWAVQTADDETICKIAEPLQQYYDMCGRCLESVAALRLTQQRLEPLVHIEQKALTLAFVLNLLGWTYMRIGQLTEAQSAMERSLGIYETLAAAPPLSLATDPVIGLGNLANVNGNYMEALRLAEAARQRHEERGDQHNLQITYYVLANATFALGQHELAGTHARHAYAFTQATGNRWFGAYVLSDLGHVARALGNYDQARDYYQASHSIKAEFADREGMAVTLCNLAKVAWLEADYVEAERLYQESLALYRQIDDQGGLSTALSGLGDTACAFGQVENARRYFQQALQNAVTMQYWPLTLAILVSVGELCLQSDQRTRATELFTLALHHPATHQETKRRAKAALQRAKIQLPATVTTTTSQPGNDQELRTVAEALLLDLATTKKTGAQAATAVPHLASPADQPLIEPLTDRELEVLHLLANGSSNREIAEKLIIAIGTVKSYTANIYGKLGVRSRTQAVARARTLKLLTD